MVATTCSLDSSATNRGPAAVGPTGLRLDRGPNRRAVARWQLSSAIATGSLTGFPTQGWLVHHAAREAV